MDQKEFIDRLNFCFKTNKKDNSLLSHENKFLRAQLLLNNISSISKILSLFDFKDKILFEDNLPFIVIEDIKLLLNHKFYLKHTGKKFLSSSNESINFLNHFKINPQNIIDLGACWGEFSLFLSKQFPKSKIYSIEGSEKNFNVLKINLDHNLKFSNNIEPYNMIISNKDGFEEILDSVSTMNTVKRLKNKQEGNYNNIKASTINSFISKLSLEVVDFLKIDIEGSEQSLLTDLKKLFFKSIQIELINYNSIESNINFVKELSPIYNFYNPANWEQLTFDYLQNLVVKTLKTNSKIDIFLINKELTLQL